MKRREFLQLVSVVTFQVSLADVLGGCDSSGANNPPTAASFPQGIASADPRPDSVVLWARAQPLGAAENEVFLQVELASDREFGSVILREAVVATVEQDFTVHVRVVGLDADQIYYYRFISNAGDISPTGRTWTAPSADSQLDIPLAFVSCQERKHGFYGAYRRMLQDDRVAPREQQIRFVLHLGDFIYETDEPWQDPLDERYRPIASGLIEPGGAARDIGRFPDGATTPDGIYHADTVADYRHLYKTYLQDPDLLAARARWPFVCIWDDHEFSDDCWQTEANYIDKGAGSSTDEPSQRRRVAANQAWSEFIPMDYTLSAGSDPALHQAHEFEFAEVADTSNLTPNADNTAAIGTLTIYRRLQFGQMLDLILTDNRSYRSDHAVPEDISGNLSAFIHPRAIMPLDLVNQLDAGREANAGQPQAFFSVAGSVFPNPRRSTPPGSILGATQKQWWKSVLQQSTARWKVWGNSVPLLRLKVNLSDLDSLLPDVVASSDAWDGYAHERKELMRFLKSTGIKNVVSLSGDVHAHFAGRIMDDFDASAPNAVMVEAVTAAISSLSMFSGVERSSRRSNPGNLESAVRSLVVFPDPDDPEQMIPNLDNTLLNGVQSGLAAARGETQEAVAAQRDPTVNPHLVHAETDAHGYGLATFSAAGAEIRLVTLRTIVDNGTTDQVRSVIKLQVPLAENGVAITKV